MSAAFEWDIIRCHSHAVPVSCLRTVWNVSDHAPSHRPRSDRRLTHPGHFIPISYGAALLLNSSSLDFMDAPNENSIFWLPVWSHHFVALLSIKRI